MSLLAPSAFLASAASTRGLQDELLPADFTSQDSHVQATLNEWRSRHIAPEPIGSCRERQASWDNASIATGLQGLQNHFTEPYHKARLLAVQEKHSGDWLHAWPITACGLRLDDNAIKVAVGLRLGANLCTPHTCHCGTLVDARGNHGLACRRSQGRLTRHSLLNDTIQRALSRAGVQATREPVGLLRNDGKRPDGCTVVAWSRGKCLAWDATTPDTLAASHLADSSQTPASAAERAASLKIQKYSEIIKTHLFCAVAVETMGPINKDGTDFLSEIGRRATKISGDPRESAFLFQRISVIIQRCNAISFLGTFVSPQVTG